ncbi:MAG: BREX-2 system phosphatase PglZ [Myxococcales bacterium]|nr:BREX-2 system phosphatase PglZ [Myxococcales bacterium]
MRRHELSDSDEQTAVVRRAEMAVRLATWLVARADRELPPATTACGDVETPASRYVREGGYLDWARRGARGTDDGAFGRGVVSVLAAVDAARVELDRRFAAGLRGWHEAGRPSTQVVPIDQAVKRLAGRFLREKAERRLLVVLMDGMAWAQAAELLESMGRRASVWGPLAWHGLAGHRIGDAPFPPVITTFPSLTEISRAAFFAGKPMPAGPSPNTQDDPKRWRAHRDMVKFCGATDAPQLLLRGDGQTADGSATPEALSQVLDRSRRVTAVVINTIDMSLKTDAAHQHVWTLDTVKALRDLLERAAEAGRAVLLCSDHGHVPSDRFTGGVRLQDGGARWRPWASADAPVGEHEIGLAAADGVWAPRGAHGVVLLADDTQRYGGGTGAGEHGGATLAEALAPCLFVGCKDNPAAEDDPGQAVRPARSPTWWNFDVGGTEPVLEVDDPRSGRRKKPAPDNQLALVGVTPPVAPTPAPRRPPSASPLATAPLLIARVVGAAERERVVAAVEFLRSRGGVADAAAFAAELGEFVARVSGLVSRMQEVLNVDGYQVLRYDRQGKQVHLDVAKLAQQFEVTL